MKNVNLKHEIMRYVAMIVASFSFALSLDLFLVPHQIVGGSLTGLSTLVNIITEDKIGVGVLTVIFDIPILILGLKKYGWKFILRCLLTILVLGGIVDLFSFLPSLTDNILMASIYAGLAQGIAIGLYCKFNVSSGGTELLGRIIADKTKIASIPVFIGILDGIIVLTGAIVLENPENVLYALIVIFTSTIVSDNILTGLNKAKLCYIITDKPDEVSNLLLNNSPRGITGIHGVGMYTKKDKGVLMTVIKKHQLGDVKRMVHQIDEFAFVIVSETTEVLGNGFKNIEEDPTK